MYNQPVLSTEKLIPARVQGSGVAEKDEVGCADWVEIQRQVIERIGEKACDSFFLYCGANGWMGCVNTCIEDCNFDTFCVTLSVLLDNTMDRSQQVKPAVWHTFPNVINKVETTVERLLVAIIRASVKLGIKR